MQNISQDKQMQLEYEAREKAVRDHNQMMKEAREVGEKIGREKMREIAKSEALERARNMVKDGLPPDKIALYSGLSLQEIENL